MTQTPEIDHNQTTLPVEEDVHEAPTLLVIESRSLGLYRQIREHPEIVNLLAKAGCTVEFIDPIQTGNQIVRGKINITLDFSDKVDKSISITLQTGETLRYVKDEKNTTDIEVVQVTIHNPELFETLKADYHAIQKNLTAPSERETQPASFATKVRQQIAQNPKENEEKTDTSNEQKTDEQKTTDEVVPAEKMTILRIIERLGGLSGLSGLIPKRRRQ